MNNQKLGYTYAFLAALMWGSTAAVTKLLLNHLTNSQVLFFSTFFALLILLAICVAQGKLSEIKRYTLNDYATFAFMGFVGVFLYRYFLQAALQLMSAQEAFIINYTWPIMVVVFAWLILKEQMTWRKLLGLLLSFFGVVVVATKGDFSTLSFSIGGVLFALAGAIVYGFYSYSVSCSFGSRVLTVIRTPRCRSLRSTGSNSSMRFDVMNGLSTITLS
jgi:drug/metabolite transporter (DMT)-like permease